MPSNVMTKLEAGCTWTDPLTVTRFCCQSIRRIPNEVGARVLVDVDSGEEISRDVFKVQPAPVPSGEDVATVEFGADPRQSANEHTAAFGREPRRVTRFVGALKRDSGDSLEGFRHR